MPNVYERSVKLGLGVLGACSMISIWLSDLGSASCIAFNELTELVGVWK